MLQGKSYATSMRSSSAKAIPVKAFFLQAIDLAADGMVSSRCTKRAVSLVRAQRNGKSRAHSAKAPDNDSVVLPFICKVVIYGKSSPTRLRSAILSTKAAHQDARTPGSYPTRLQVVHSRHRLKKTMQMIGRSRKPCSSLWSSRRSENCKARSLPHLREVDSGGAQRQVCMTLPRSRKGTSRAITTQVRTNSLSGQCATAARIPSNRSRTPTPDRPCRR